MTINNINNQNTTTNFCGSEMMLLKTYIYSKDCPNNFKRYLTLFTFIPVGEYKSEIQVIKDVNQNPISTNTYGVYIKIIGSTANLIQTHNRTSLSAYQKHLENNGWQFVATVPGTKGMDFEVARKLAWAEICKIKKGGDKETADKDGDKESFKESIFKSLEHLEANFDCGVDIMPDLVVLRNLVQNF